MKPPLMSLEPPLLELWEGDFSILVCVDSTDYFIDLIVTDVLAESFGYFLQLRQVYVPAGIQVKFVEDGL